MGTTPESRSIVTGLTLLADAEIGVTLLDAAGQNYDDTPYSNLKYTTANGTDWAISGADAPLLKATDGKAIAYYPWKDGADYTALAVETASQTDYMYSGWVEGINNSAPEASFQMEHGLSAFRSSSRRMPSIWQTLQQPPSTSSPMRSWHPLP